MQSPSLRESLVSLVRQYPVLDGGTDQSVRAVQELIERTYHRVYGECDTEWSGGRYPNDRPAYRLSRGGSVVASRIVHCLYSNMPLTEIRGLVVRHSCDNGACLSPVHLSVGTQAQNVRDSIERGRWTRGEGHGQARLTAEQVRDIRRRYVPGTSRWSPGNRRELQAEYGIGRSQILDIAKGRKWAHVDA